MPRRQNGLSGQTGRGGVAFGIDEAHDALGQGDARLGIIGDAQLEEQVGKAHDAQADLAVAAHGLVDAFQREARGVDDVVQEAHGQMHHLLQAVPVDTGRGGIFVMLVAGHKEAGQIDGAQVAGLVGQQGLFAAGVGGFDLALGGRGVVAVDAV